MRRVLISSTMVSYHTHNMFVNLFYLDDHEAPVSSVDTLNDYYKTLNETAYKFIGNFMANVTFPDEKHLVVHEFEFVNGSHNIEYSPELDPLLLKSVKTIKTTIPTYIISSKKKVPGCSQWTLEITVSMVKTDPAFWLSSKIHRSQCPREVYESNQEQLEYFVWTRRSLFPLVVLLSFHIIVDFWVLLSRIKTHNTFLKNDHRYKQMPSRRQLHFTIGWWVPLEILFSVGTLCTAVIAMMDSHTMTELPSLSVMVLFSIAAFFQISLCCQLFAYTKTLYLYVLIVRDGFGLFFDVTVGTLPFLFASLLCGIFMFASIAPKARSFWGMYEIVNSFEFSNNIENIYNEFSDGTPLFNWLAFIYITIVVLVSGWVVLASLLAAVLCIHSMITNKQKRD